MKRIAVITGSRADFGLLLTVIDHIRDHDDLELELVPCGLHLVDRGGIADMKPVPGTLQDIFDAGHEYRYTVRVQTLGKRTRYRDVDDIATGIQGFNRCFDELKPDVVLVLGDRIEVFAAAIAASVGGYHLAHIHGGDRAVGVNDESMRHAISKMAHIHFAATHGSLRRLVKMGEGLVGNEGSWAFDVGSPAIDGLDKIEPAKASGYIVIQHPVGAEDWQEQAWMEQTLEALKGEPVAIFAPNCDPGSDGIRKALEEHVTRPDLPRKDFLRLLKSAKAIIGNSSAGLIEAAALGIPCVNVGPRQDGREIAANVVHCPYGTGFVRGAIVNAEARDLLNHWTPYGDGTTGFQITDILANIDLSKVPQQKRNAY